MSNTVTDVKATGLPSYEDYKNQLRAPNKNLGQKEFLSLLASQMQYQDPLEPTKDTAFIAQLAQFTSLEQMSGLNKIVSTFQYYSLAGKCVYAEVTLEDGMEHAVYGIVDRVVMKDGTAYAQVGDYLIDASKISQVWDKELFTSGNPLLDTASLIGRTVTAETTGSNGEAAVVTGVVDRVALEEGKMVAFLETGEKLAVNEITDIKR